MHIGDKIVKFQDNNDGLYLSKPDGDFFGKLAEENKRNIIEWLKNLQTVGGNKRGFRKHQYKRALVARKHYHLVEAPTLQKLKIMIRKNIIHNFPVMVEDIEI